MKYPKLLAFLGLGLISQATAECSRESLQEAAAAYVRAVVAGDPLLLNLAANASYAENNMPIPVREGIFSQPIAVDFDRSIYDTVQCATMTELNAATSEHPYVIHTRILYAATGGDNKITRVESVVTDEGDWVFDAAEHLRWTAQEAWDAIPAERRDARDVLQAAGDAYLDQWGDVEHPVPLGTPCARLEGGLYTGGTDPEANTCAMGAFPQPLQVGDRRYVIDEELGVVDIFNGFPWIDASKPENASTPSSNMIRVEGGMIRYIHELTVCGVPGCGR
ncbi:hypothetical protein F4778DRAFT_309836 [Xylariomycetidae sp. FL2044]|nr:hypothetical protein F4778DRAFT_309836 [Xylariomycetidae sp. FL2044]